MSDLGEITPCWTITFRRESTHSPQRLWHAITDPDEVSKWMGYPARIDLRPGGDYHLDFSRSREGDDGGELDGVIVRVVGERHLAIVWGRSVLEWDIEPDGERCRYTFAHHGQEPPSEGDRHTDEGIAAGWHAFLDAFAAHLDGAPPAAVRANAQPQLEARYRERVAAVIKSQT
jgi:uncharacterized protein YndB with AHSA1/START domain